MNGLRPQGVVLIVSLLLVFSIAFLGHAAMALNPGLLSLSSHTVKKDLARRAADSGLEYALNRLKEEPTWFGDGNAVIIDEPGLYVEESGGNVIGLITSEDGKVSQFRIRFNYQDGDAGGDSVADPTAEFWVDHPYVSRNNLGTTAPNPLPRGDGSNFEVTDPASGTHTVPGQAVSVIVEGRSGPGLQNHTKASANASPSGTVTSRVTEACFKLSVNSAVPHAAVMGGGDVNFMVPATGRVLVQMRGDYEDRTPRIRSKGSVAVSTPSGGVGELLVSNTRGEIGRNPSGLPGFQGNLTGQGADIVNESVGDGTDFYKLQWDDVTQASSDPNTSDTIRIPAGTYVAWDDNTLHYYDMDFESYKTFMTDPANHSDPGTPLTWGLREIRESANIQAVRRVPIWPEPMSNGQSTLSLNLESDTRVITSSSGVSDFTLTTRRGAQYSPDDTSDLIPGAGDSYTSYNVQLRLEQSTFSAPGDINILGKLVGRSSTITAEGGFRMVTPYGKMQRTWNDPDAPYGLNLYSKGDIKMSGFREYWNNFSQVRMAGLVYTWGNFECITGHPAIPEQDWAEGEFKGSIVAYGSDPASGTPGSSGNGTVTFQASEVELYNNYDTIAAVVNPESGNLSMSMERTLYVTH